MRRQGLPKSGLQSKKEFMALLLAGNTFVCSLAFECEVGDVVLSQRTLVTSLVPYCYGKFLCAVASQGQGAHIFFIAFCFSFLQNE